MHKRNVQITDVSTLQSDISNIHTIYFVGALGFLFFKSQKMIERLTSASKRGIGAQINAQQISSSLAARSLQCSTRTARRYAWRLSSGIPIHGGGGRPKTLDEEHFLQLVDFARSLPPSENLAENAQLYNKYRELTRANLIKRFQEVNQHFDAASLVVPYSKRSRKRYCRLAAASI